MAPSYVCRARARTKCGDSAQAIGAGRACYSLSVRRQAWYNQGPSDFLDLEFSQPVLQSVSFPGLRVSPARPTAFLSLKVLYVAGLVLDSLFIILVLLAHFLSHKYKHTLFSVLLLLLPPHVPCCAIR